jgi:phosphopantetheinyl transferase (holo-ACP synthase)
MERNVALQRLQKMLGKQLRYRIDPNAPSPEERAAAKEAYPALLAAKEAALKALEERHQALLAGDIEYQRLKAEAKVAREAASQNGRIRTARKITVGTSNGLWFHVKAEGDSWEEIFAALAKKS